MNDSIVFNIIPCPYPRRTQFTKWWEKRSKKYYNFMNFVKLKVKVDRFQPGDRLAMNFYFPMPKSWPKKKKDLMFMNPHQQKPDIDNFVKAILDSMFVELGGDHTVHEIRATKKWATEGYIEVRNL